jgi:hypothetical protein
VRAAAAWDWLVDSLVRLLCALLPSRHRIIPTATDPSRPLLEQLAVLHMGRFGAIYLQRFVNPELPRFFHRHQWHRMRSVVLSGEFVEERAPLVFVGDVLPQLPDHYTPIIPAYHIPRYITHRRLSTYTMDRTVIHRTHSWSTRCWTLFWMSSPKLEDWGYYDRENGWAYTPWREQIAKQIPSLDVPERLT